jgi:hypothetical protein
MARLYESGSLMLTWPKAWGLTQVFKELEHESQDSFWPPEEDETPVHGADLMTRFLALLGCLMPIVVLYYVKRAMGAPPHPQVCDRVPGAF